MTCSLSSFSTIIIPPWGRGEGGNDIIRQASLELDAKQASNATQSQLSPCRAPSSALLRDVEG